MHKYDHESLIEEGYTSWAPAGVAGWTADPVDAAVQDFLDRVCAPLIGEVPYSQRTELREELGQHLRALIQAHIELGEPHDVAIAKAEEQFGRPEKLARNWTAVQARQKPGRRVKRWFRSQWQGMCAAAAVASVVCLYMLSFSAHTVAPVHQNISNLIKQSTTGNFDRLALSVLMQGEKSSIHSQFASQDCRSCHASDIGLAAKFDHYWDLRAAFSGVNTTEWKFPAATNRNQSTP